MRKYGTTGAVFFLLVVLVVFVVSLTSIANKREEPLTYSHLMTMLNDPKQAQDIEKVEVTNQESVIQVKLKNKEHSKPVVVPTESKEGLIKALQENNVAFEVKDPDRSGFWVQMLSSFFLPILLLVGFLFMFRSAQSGGNQAM